MPIVVYADVIIPNSIISAGVTGRQIRRNRRAGAENGQMKVNVQWSNTLRQYELGTVPLTVAQWQALEGLFEVTDGGAYGCLMQDPKDTIVDAAAGLLAPYTTSLVGAIGAGYGVPVYKLHKRYTSAGSARTKDRAITRPQLTPIVKRAGATVTHGAAAGNIAINYTSGTVTFVADASSAVTGVVVGATTQVTLTAALAGLAIGERLYLSGLTGAGAATLNNLSHAITNITGAGLNVYTLSTVTTGLTITAAGSGFKYPQSSQALTWGGLFYVPVHFANDEIDWELTRAGDLESRLMSGPRCVLDEIRE